MNLIQRDQLGTITILSFFLIGIIIVIASIHYHLNKIHIGLAFAIPPLIYLSLEQRIKKNTRISIDINQRLFYIFTTIFFLLLSLTLLSLHSETYTRPLIFFVFIAINYVIITTQILFYDYKKNSYLILLEIIIISIVVRASIYFEYSTVYGNDTFFHIKNIQLILSNGILPATLDTYINYPYFHLLVASISQITCLSAKNALFFISIIEILGSLFVFLIARQFVSKKMALFSTMMITLAPYYIYWGFWLIPMTLGIVFFIIIIYLFIKNYLIIINDKINSKKISFLLLFFCFSSIFIHTVAPFVTLLSLSLIFIGVTLFISIFFYTTEKKQIPFFKIIILYIVVLYWITLFVYWMNVNKSGGESIFSLFFKSLTNSLTKVDTTSTGVVTLAPQYNYITILLSDLPFTFLLFFAIFGGIIFIRYFFHKTSDNQEQIKIWFRIRNFFYENLRLKFSDKNKKSEPLMGNQIIMCIMIVAAFFLLCLVYAAGFLGLDAILPDRWFVFIEILLIVPASYGIFSLVCSSKNMKSRLFISSIIIFIFAFSAITIPMNNGDNPLYANELNSRSGLFDSEVTPATFLSSNYNGNISRDAKYELIEGNMLNPNDTNSFNNTMIVIRNYDFEKGFTIPLFGAKAKLLEIVFPNEKFLESLNNSNKVYENGQVRIYPYFR